MVEHSTLNRQVEGSSPSGSTNFFQNMSTNLLILWWTLCPRIGTPIILTSCNGLNMSISQIIHGKNKFMAD